MSPRNREIYVRVAVAEHLGHPTVHPNILHGRRMAPHPLPAPYGYLAAALVLVKNLQRPCVITKLNVVYVDWGIIISLNSQA